MKSLEKNKLDLEYNNLLNWRSILFGAYFALLALTGGFISLIVKENFLIFIIYMSVSSFLLWQITDAFRYREIKEKL